MDKVQLTRFVKVITFFAAGIILASFVLILSFLATFFFSYQDKIYPGVSVEKVDLSGLAASQARSLLAQKYDLSEIVWRFQYHDKIWQFTSAQIGLSVPINNLVSNAYQVGRGPNIYQSFKETLQSYLQGESLPLTVSWDSNDSERLADIFRPTTDIAPIDAQFRFQTGAGPDLRGRVVAFIPSSDGQELNSETLRSNITDSAQNLLLNGYPVSPITLTVAKIVPKVTSDQANNLGIVNKLGSGESFFYDSIPTRVYNIGLGTEKINGSLVAPGEIFSFDQAIGTVSAIFGFQKAYAIVHGKTVLDDGGGVCQVSTTLYRAVLNSGLPVIQRVAHSYRVGFYEEGGYLPGLDATVYPPDPDFQFKNDTANWILIQANFDKNNSKLTFDIYGTSDGRISQVSKPVILSTSPPPDPVYEDDPTLQNGQVKQVDTAHYGAKVYFTRQVTRGNDILINETVSSNYIPWPARFLRGTRTT